MADVSLCLITLNTKSLKTRILSDITYIKLANPVQKGKFLAFSYFNSPQTNVFPPISYLSYFPLTTNLFPSKPFNSPVSTDPNATPHTRHPCCRVALAPASAAPWRTPCHQRPSDNFRWWSARRKFSWTASLLPRTAPNSYPTDTPPIAARTARRCTSALPPARWSHRTGNHRPVPSCVVWHRKRCDIAHLVNRRIGYGWVQLRQFCDDKFVG